MTPAAEYAVRRSEPNAARRLGWHSPASQLRHHATLFGLLDTHLPLDGRHVLDVGCGDGCAVPWVRERGGFYAGVDSRPDVVADARLDHPDASFDCVDAAAGLPSADVCIAIGTLAWHSPESAVALLDAMWRAAGRGVAFTSWHGFSPWAEAQAAVERWAASRRALSVVRLDAETRYWVVLRGGPG